MKPIISFLIIFLISCNSNNYSNDAEHEINENIRKRLTVNSPSFDKVLKKYFEDYLTENNFTYDQATISSGYYKYLKYIAENGSSGVKIRNDSLTIRIKNELKALGLNTKKGIQNLLYESVSPVAIKYKGKLKSENSGSKLIQGIAESRLEDDLNLHLVISGLLSDSEPTNFENAFLQNFVLLFAFVQMELNEQS
jgi:hypothetical protein